MKRKNLSCTDQAWPLLMLLLGCSRGASAPTPNDSADLRARDQAAVPKPSAVTGSISAPAPRGPVCGNGLLEGDERCDDGNHVRGDGCSPMCREEIVKLSPGGRITSANRVLCDLPPGQCPALAELSRPPRNLKIVDTAIGGTGGDAALTKSREAYLIVKPSQQVQPAPEPFQGHVVAISGAPVNGGICVLLDTNEVWCHGRVHGNVGLAHARKPQEEPIAHWEHVLLNSRRPVVALAGGMGEGCVVLHDGALQCWGIEWEPRNRILRHQPLTDVPLGGRRVKSLAFSGSHYCAVFESGEIGCWGEGTHGELGYVNTSLNECTGLLEDPSDRIPLFCHWHPPNRALPLPAKAKSVYVAYGLSCAYLENRELWCWGDIGRHAAFREPVEHAVWVDRIAVRTNQGEKLRANASTLPTSPISMPKDCEPEQMDIGASTFCALCTGGCLTCWGKNADSLQGYGKPPESGPAGNGCREL